MATPADQTAMDMFIQTAHDVAHNLKQRYGSQWNDPNVQMQYDKATKPESAQKTEEQVVWKQPGEELSNSEVTEALNSPAAVEATSQELPKGQLLLPNGEPVLSESTKKKPKLAESFQKAITKKSDIATSSESVTQQIDNYLTDNIISSIDGNAAASESLQNVDPDTLDDMEFEIVKAAQKEIE
jgi:hypothetical protein